MVKGLLLPIAASKVVLHDVLIKTPFLYLNILGRPKEDRAQEKECPEEKGCEFVALFQLVKSFCPSVLF